MAKLNKYRDYIEEIINWRAKIGYANSDLEMIPVFDRPRDNYLLMVNGREDGARVHFDLIHVQLLNGKFWIHYDGLEDGVATYLLEKGVPKEDIVLAFYSPEKRKLTDFAIAEKMTAEEIEQYLREVGDELALKDVKGEICLYGGAVMCLVYKARPATKDIDAIFEPVKYIRSAIRIIAERHDLPFDWLNFAVKMFVVEHKKETFLDLPNLKVFVPAPEYLLAMKVLAARVESFDLEDIKFLIDKLKLQSVEDALQIVENYYPHKIIKPETQFLLEELFEEK